VFLQWKRKKGCTMVNVVGTDVHFRFFRPQAQKVYLVGNFAGRGWQELAMTRAEDGYWTALLSLDSGTYRFRYRADGEWFTDYAAFGVEYGPLGVNSVIRVTERRQTIPLRYVAPVRRSAPEVSIRVARAPRRRLHSAGHRARRHSPGHGRDIHAA
jgi:1,4-alpha-glucan branching enzyme